MFTRTIARSATAAATCVRRSTGTTQAVRSMSVFSVFEKDTTKLEKQIADFNADVAVDFPRFPVWGPRVPLDVSESYEADAKNFFETHWDEVVDMDRSLRKTAEELVAELPPKIADKLELPHPKSSLGVSDLTEKYYDEWMGADKEQRVLMPLCGGWSVEMGAFAALGHRVVGVEYVRAAVDALAIYEILPEFQEEGWRNNFLIHHSPESGAIVAEGNFFDATPEELGTFDKAFDRCGITSVARERIPEYANVLHSLMKPGAKLLMETMSASGDPQGANDTYAWCTPEELAKVFKSPQWKFQELETSEVTNLAPYSDLNLDNLKQHFFLITRV